MGPRTQVLGLRLPDGTKSRQNLGTCTRRESCQKWLSADPALRVERRGSPLFHFLGHLGSLGSCCARNGFWCCHNIRPKLGRSLICDNRSSQCPYCVLFSRLGSLTTVLTWLRSRACAGMQGWALCACVQTGFTHHGSHLVAVACMCRDAGGSVSVGSCCTFTQCSGHHMEL